MDDPRATRGAESRPEPEQDGVTGDVCWLAATCTECGALVEGGTCWNCGARRTE
ncbi:hypothetical protein BCL57_001496 [Agromyces flavus]|uniref:Small CPxCG-related zinc finger protein n=1 Tax=Agromyces flavus TaxID=589382 RepID=A0ABT1KKC7_9MICO|nr:hypothetical protein [Agromyces flavus]MCP2367342.1 hypothetical protein [Agromyces flavus]